MSHQRRVPLRLLSRNSQAQSLAPHWRTRARSGPVNSVAAARTAGQAVADNTAPKPGRLWAEVLEKVPLFAGVSARHVRKIAALGSAVSFNAKTRIVSAGDPGDAFYVLLLGRAEVQRGRGRPKIEIGPGAYFGEMALLDGAPRSATGTATWSSTSRRATSTRWPRWPAA